MLVLLGAGASAAVGFPTSLRLIETLLEEERLIQAPQHRRALYYVYHRLAAQAAADGRGEAPTIDVERVLTVLEQLAEFDTLPIAPFTAGLSREIGAFGVERTSGMVDSRLADAIGKAERDARNNPRHLTREIEKFRRAVVHEAGTTSPSALFQSVRRSLVDAMVVYLSRPASTLEPFAPFASLIRSGRIATVASLNFDTTLEQWLDSNDIAYELPGAKPSRAPAPGRLSVLKLHGSVDWKEGPYQEPALILGEGNKLRAEGPFLDLFIQFRQASIEATRILVVGYSFRDQHINTVLASWLAEDVSREIDLIDPDPILAGFIRNANMQRHSAHLQLHGAAAEPADAINLIPAKMEDGLPEYCERWRT